MLGKALTEAGDGDSACEAFREGIEVARTRGDKQVEKEIAVFLKRLEKSRP